MGKLVRAVVLVAGMGALMSAGGLVSDAPAQDKKAKEAKAAKDDIGKVEVYKGKDGWRFRIKNAGGKSIAMAVTGLDTKEDVLKNLEIIKATLNKGKIE